MSHAKVIVHERGRKICPVCGKPSYSSGGIHPQCASRQSEQPRLQRLQAERRLASAKKKPPRQKSWNRKCPKCHIEVHIRRKVCDCGYKLDGA